MEEEKLNEMYEMTKENNQMLRTMRRNAMIGSIVKFIFWVAVLVVIPYFTWLYIQPYLNSAMSAYQNVQHTGTSVQNSTSANLSQIQKFFQQFGGGNAK